MSEIILQCSVVRWEDVVAQPGRPVLAGGVDAGGKIRYVQVDEAGRGVWAPEVDQLRRDLAEARVVAQRCARLAHHAILLHRRDGRPLLGAEGEQAAIWREHPWVPHRGEAEEAE